MTFGDLDCPALPCFFVRYAMPDQNCPILVENDYSALSKCPKWGTYQSFRGQQGGRLYLVLVTSHHQIVEPLQGCHPPGHGFRSEGHKFPGKR